MTHVTCRLTAKNRDRLRNPTLGSRSWATFTFLLSAMYSWSILTSQWDFTPCSGKSSTFLCFRASDRWSLRHYVLGLSVRLCVVGIRACGSGRRHFPACRRFLVFEPIFSATRWIFQDLFSVLLWLAYYTFQKPWQIILKTNLITLFWTRSVYIGLHQRWGAVWCPSQYSIQGGSEK